jgi:hypothetical protein
MIYIPNSDQCENEKEGDPEERQGRQPCGCTKGTKGTRRTPRSHGVERSNAEHRDKRK